jgi:hypothetical protein
MDNNIDETMKLTTIKSNETEVYELIQNTFNNYIWPKLGTVKKIVISNDIPKLEFNKLVSNIFNIFKQNNPTSTENLKPKIKEFVHKTLKIMSNRATNYLLKKVKSKGKIPKDIKVFRTKIIINEYISIQQLFDKNFQTKIKRESSNIICSHTKEYKISLKNDIKKDAFGKTKYEYLKEAIETYNNFDYKDMQILYGTIHFIKEINYQINKLSDEDLEKCNIKKLTNYLYEIPLQLSNKFFNFFSYPDKKIGRNKKPTNYQTYTKKTILNTIRKTIVPLRFPIINNDIINFTQPLKEIDPLDFNTKSIIKIVIDTRILLTDYLTHEDAAAFICIPSMQEIETLGNAWDEVVKKDITPEPNLYKIYKNFRIDRYKDTLIKLRNIIYFMNRGPTTIKNGYIISRPIHPIHKEELENNLLDNNRINKDLKKYTNYKLSNRSDTISTIQKIKDIIISICFSSLFNDKYIKKFPTLSKDKKYHISINPFKINKQQANQLKKPLKIPG